MLPWGIHGQALFDIWKGVSLKTRLLVFLILTLQ
jgi:hypothetical protein